MRKYKNEETITQNGWISVKDRLPEKQPSFCLVFNIQIREIHETLFSDDEFWYFGEIVKASHWMPLPEPPEGI